MKRLLKNFLSDISGVLLLAILLFVPLFWLLLGLTLDTGNARYSATTAKTALNRAVKAAALALDEEKLSFGYTRLDPIKARNNFDEMMKLNLKLNADYTPSAQSPVTKAPEVLDFYICQGPVFPYVYNTVLGITFTFHDPGVIAVIRVNHKYVFAGREQEIFVYSTAEIKD